MNPMNPDGDANNWLSCMTLAKGCKVTPYEVMDALAEENIETRPIWKPMHLQPVFADAPYYGEKVAEELFENGLCLPSGSNLTDEERTRIAQKIKEVFGK